VLGGKKNQEVSIVGLDWCIGKELKKQNGEIRGWEKKTRGKKRVVWKCPLNVDNPTVITGREKLARVGSRQSFSAVGPQEKKSKKTWSFSSWKGEESGAGSGWVKLGPGKPHQGVVKNLAHRRLKVGGKRGSTR